MKEEISLRQSCALGFAGVFALGAQVLGGAGLLPLFPGGLIFLAQGALLQYCRRKGWPPEGEGKPTWRRRSAVTLYIMWCVLLLGYCLRVCQQRMAVMTGSAGSGWGAAVVLLLIAALTCRRSPAAVARAGRVFFALLLCVLLLVGVLSVSAVEPVNFLTPPRWEGLWGVWACAAALLPAALLSRPGEKEDTGWAPWCLGLAVALGCAGGLTWGILGRMGAEEMPFAFFYAAQPAATGRFTGRGSALLLGLWLGGDLCAQGALLAAAVRLCAAAFGKKNWHLWLVAVLAAAVAALWRESALPWLVGGSIVLGSLLPLGWALLGRSPRRGYGAPAKPDGFVGRGGAAE